MIAAMRVTTKYRFSAKSCGWCWGVLSTWQSWAVLGTFAALLIVTNLMFSPYSAPLAFGASVLFLGTALGISLGATDARLRPSCPTTSNA
jgi:hypothetical protein